MVPKLHGTRDQFRGRQSSHRSGGWRGMAQAVMWAMGSEGLRFLIFCSPSTGSSPVPTRPQTGSGPVSLPGVGDPCPRWCCRSDGLLLFLSWRWWSPVLWLSQVPSLPTFTGMTSYWWSLGRLKVNHLHSFIWKIFIQHFPRAHAMWGSVGAAVSPTPSRALLSIREPLVTGGYFYLK